jgi:hypothetical protein
VFHLHTEQDGDETASAVREVQEYGKRSKEGGVQYLGSLPILACQVMARESGTKVGSREFNEYATKKLKGGDMAAFSVRNRK